MRQVSASARVVRRYTPLLAAASLTLPLAATSASAAEAQTPASLWLPTSATPTGEYLTQPELDAPLLTTNGEDIPGLLLTTPNPDNDQADSKAIIYDENGEVVWYDDAGPDHGYFDMEPITYQGEEALMVWEGKAGVVPGEKPETRYVILDSSYQEVASFEVQGYPTDSHDIEFSADGSKVLLMSYMPVQYDLSEYGGPTDARLVNGVIQEQDLETGEVTFEWNALDSIPISETEVPLDRPDMTGGFDVYHLNSLEYDDDGNILTSARSTSTVYKLDQETGEIIWRFGGESNDFTFADASQIPSGQHDARRLSNGLLSVFDNGNRHDPPASRGASYELDEENMTAELVNETEPELPIFAAFAGSNRQQENGDQLITFGNTGRITEFEDGEEDFSAQLEHGWMTYRGEIDDWHATPTTAPDAVLGEVAGDGSQTMYMSWNGATDVAGWLIEAGPSEDELSTVGYAERAGFETGAEIASADDAAVYKVTALGEFGEALGSTTVTR
ncbi:arylsulfotransferase family protein [Streptomyces sp. B6B3]|uniref:arylsulfotransferase family protein n=1 Tax=Streptomyces sp. B6B3 TaxID=3153570 RepID=UPI00325E8F2F